MNVIFSVKILVDIVVMIVMIYGKNVNGLILVLHHQELVMQTYNMLVHKDFVLILMDIVVIAQYKQVMVSNVIKLVM